MKQLQTFFYFLLRDHLPAGTVETIVRQAEEGKDLDPVYSNKDLAAYAEKLVNRINE